MLNFMCIKMLITASTVGADRCTTNELLRLLMVAHLNGYRPVLADVCQTSGPRFEPLLAKMSNFRQALCRCSLVGEHSLMIESPIQCIPYDGSPNSKH